LSGSRTSLPIGSDDRVVAAGCGLALLDSPNNSVVCGHFFGLRHFYHLSEHELGGDPTHGFQHVAEAGANFLLVRLDPVYGSSGEILRVHPFLILHFLGKLSSEKWGLDCRGCQFNYGNACAIELNAQGLGE
jgi:hypothetical protein